MTPKIGQFFNHRHWLASDYSGKPLRCKITKIARGTVYYRPLYGHHEDGSEWLGAPAYFAIENAGRYMLPE